jgi:thiol-disulfide isomerase/thioredoxin
MRRILIALFCAALLAFAKTPRPLADITLAAPPGGKPVKLTSYAGKVMVILMFSTECRTCAEAAAILERVQRDYKDKGVVIVGAAANPGAISLIRPFMNRYKVTFPMGVLTEAEARRLGDFGPADVLKTPTLLFVDKNGTVRQHFPGDSPFLDNAERNTRLSIDALLR